jgi:hypothetical protein
MHFFVRDVSVDGAKKTYATPRHDKRERGGVTPAEITPTQIQKDNQQSFDRASGQKSGTKEARHVI